METNVRTPMQIFSLPQRLVVPLFQRPYVWDQEEQWAPLWSDIRRLTEVRLRDPFSSATHFLGAVVVQAHDGQLGNMASSNIIDGQQRLTTLQVLMDAAASVLESAGLDTLAGQLESLTHNQATFVPSGESRLKIRHTNRDHAAFDEVMDADPPVDHDELKHASSKIARAHAYFTDAIGSWLGDAGHEAYSQRANALVAVLTSGLQLVAINLTATENSQEIFETLNARGTPLTAADLIKNFVFQRLAAEGADTQRAYADDWPFDTKFWETEVSVGRYRVSRSSLFLNQWLTARLGEEISPQQTFTRFKAFVEHDAGQKMGDLLPTIKEQADRYEAWTVAADDKDRQLSTVEMSIYRMKASELELLKPLLIWLHEPDRNLPSQVIDGVVTAAESWIMRRMFLRLTTADLGRVVADVIRIHGEAPAVELVDRVRGHLARLNVSSNYWPGDDEIRTALTEEAAYRRFKVARVRLFLEAVENEFRKETNQPQVPRRGYPIEHVLPQKWQDHWPVDGLEAEIERGAHVHRLGNLTLLTSSLNSKVSNSAWQAKREALRKHDTLLLNSRLLSEAADAWTEEAIDGRSAQLIDVLLRVWPVPEGHTGQIVDPRDKSQDWVEVKDLVAAQLLEPGTVLTARPGTWAAKQALVREDGMLEVDGQLFNSPSGAGRYVKGSVANGWNFWRLPDGRRLVDVRAAFRGEKPRDLPRTAALPRVEWNEEDLGDYAASTADLTLRLLDYVASERPDELLTGPDFAVIGLSAEQVAGVTGAMARKVYNDFERSNPPVEFVEHDGRWHYRMTSQTAAVWRLVRSLKVVGAVDPAVIDSGEE
ncbi:DUF262 domain-containing protein [Nocardioides sp.]|uniref:GmrSD restriction endonuclease domain-containing protein n=1 Tax=Nocardioides sp. TaxID=35761 RepID=UPI0025F4BF24|nr:DUF262 domain-containing protein [Nocardioides sp.]